MARVSNAGSRVFVQARQEFQANNLYGQCLGSLYVVYSYGPHWPLFVCCRDGEWLENQDRYSTTTSKHRSQSHPLCDTLKVTCEELKAFIAVNAEGDLSLKAMRKAAKLMTGVN